jgi:hypothetical protein
MLSTEKTLRHAAIIHGQAETLEFIEDPKEVQDVLNLLHNSGFISFVDQAVTGKFGTDAQVRAIRIDAAIRNKVNA